MVGVENCLKKGICAKTLNIPTLMSSYWIKEQIHLKRDRNSIVVDLDIKDV